MADASIAAKAVLEGIPPSAHTQPEVPDVEDSPPSMETLRATLQVLRARDDRDDPATAPPGTAKLVHGFGADVNSFANDQSTAAALETAAVNLANAAAEAAIALEWRH